MTSPRLADQDQQTLSMLMDTLDEVTKLATKTHLNADYVPGILSVLHREELLALGMRTVGEALTLVPGIQVNRSDFGASRISIRGLEHGNGNIKMLLDSIPLNHAYDGKAMIAPIPIEQIERIEIIRGPGSAVHGEFAFVGVINVITRQDRGVHVRLDSNGGREAGGTFHVEDPDSDWRLTANLSGWDTPGTDVEAGPDVLYIAGLGDISRAPGPIDDRQEHQFAQIALQAGDFSLTGYYQREIDGVFQGAVNALPVARDGHDFAETVSWALQASQRIDFTEDWLAELQLLYSEGTFHFDQEVYPPGTPYPLDGGVPNPYGLFQELKIGSRRTQATASLEWSGWRNHHWRAEFSAASVDLTEAWWALNGDVKRLQPLPYMQVYKGALNYVDTRAHRDIRSVAIQDQWTVTRHLDLTAGLRYDRYSDVGENVSPRLAAVWRLNDEHLFKVQIADAFFPPTLLQVNGQSVVPSQEFPDTAQTIRTGEFGYIFRRSSKSIRTTLYYSELRDLVVLENGGWTNRGSARVQGVELEWEQSFGARWKVMTNLSYTDTLNQDTRGPIPGAATWLGNLGLFYRPRPDWLITTHWRFVGDRDRAADDPRHESLDGYHDISLTANWFDIGFDGLTLRAGVTNMLQARIASPAPKLTYRDDYPLNDERLWWAQISYEWD
ncbi:TonB-dependent receptor plug domain-containing protein [Imhoffiella purpurea]|uniref:TonB-dependent receptor n=1 Tax=Imhoffiella purpurea TaxID=1249627 RepID=W9VRZ3_9GAMM|nr:TonB-dependent receptor [Imhoffiella purpurea]EXJ13180.1 TonB-dependent receptor [Imhoffiella purpurea]